MKVVTALYTVRKVKKGYIFYGPTHGSCNGYESVCKLSFEDSKHWYILTTDFNGTVTCKKCINLLRTVPYQELQERKKPDIKEALERD